MDISLAFASFSVLKDLGGLLFKERDAQKAAAIQVKFTEKTLHHQAQLCEVLGIVRLQTGQAGGAWARESGLSVGAVQFDTLLALLRRALARLGRRLDPSGAGTQIGRAPGDVTINHVQPAPPPAPVAPPAPAMPPKAEQPGVSDVFSVLDALSAPRRERVMQFAQRGLGITYLKGMNARQLKRLYGYAWAALERERIWW